ncbi:DUF6302 family protein [Streptomyces sp. NPDC053750]|uniref:DUF6302 family protein n=1 Tax=Streptomyces sp. NPDC053750 TaxID=3365714 RepID=UPI0037D3031D
MGSYHLNYRSTTKRAVQHSGPISPAMPSTASAASASSLPLSCAFHTSCRARVWAAVRDRPGFPRVRIGLSVHRDTCHTVDWGPRQPWDDAERGRYFGYAPSAINTFVRRPSIPDHPAAQVEHDSDQDDGRPWHQDPLKSTLRDLGGCLTVILLGVLITLLVSAAKANATGPTPTSPPSSTWKPTVETALPAGTTSPSPLTSPRWAAR